ncbi:MAG: ribosome silencing factor [Planctomycetes bacterium]|jgi:ribosome-associated protein|nr:ribosome silencing factor [Planctomycetota bacterium]
MVDPVTLTVEQVVRLVVDAVDERKGEDLVILRMSEVLPITDYFVIATGRNNRHVDSIADLVEKRLKERGLPVQHASGRETMNWVLLDLGWVVVHLFQPAVREYYDLELKWADAEKVSPESLPACPPPAVSPSV